MISSRDSKEEPSVRQRRLLIQLGKIVLAGLSLTLVGSLYSYPSVLFTDLTHHNTTIYDTHITMDGKEDMLGSLLMVSSLPGAWLSAYMAVKMGRRRTLMVVGVVGVTGWLGLALSPYTIGILAARCVSGLAVGGVSVTANAYVTELSDVDVRGMMSMAVNLCLLFGQLLSVCVGYGTRYFVSAFVCALVPAGLTLSLIWLPESPSFLVLEGKDEDAKKVLYGLRGEHADVQEEIDQYKELNTRLATHGTSWRSLLTRETLRSFLVVSTLFVINAFCGYMVINANASRLFENAGTTVDGSMAAVVIMVVQVGGGVGGFFLMDRIGRRNILFLGFTLMATSLFAMSIYLGVRKACQNSVTSIHTSNEEEEELSMLAYDVTEAVEVSRSEQAVGWIPLAALVGSQAGSAIGVVAMPFLLSQEYFPTSIRAQACSACFTMYTLAVFAMLQSYTPMMEGLTQAGLYAFYGIVSFLGIPFTAYFITETMGKSIG